MEQTRDRVGTHTQKNGDSKGGCMCCQKCVADVTLPQFKHQIFLSKQPEKKIASKCLGSQFVEIKVKVPTRCMPVYYGPVRLKNLISEFLVFQMFSRCTVIFHTDLTKFVIFLL